MHQRTPDINMDVGIEDSTSPPQSRGRNNSKLKVLVRSHAMREETSPPREPTPTMISPCIKLTPSPTGSPNNNPVVVLSPSMSRGNSPTRSSMCVSPTSTLVPSPSRCSPLNLEAFDEKTQQYIQQSEFNDTAELSPNRVYNNNKANKPINERSNRTSSEPIKVCKDIIIEENSHLDIRKLKSETKCKCEVNQGCVKCVRSQDRNSSNNINNNPNNNQLSSPNTLMVNRSSSRGKLRQQGSSQGSFEGSSSNSPCLSRDSSSEQYTDTTGIDLEVFIPDTLNRNAKDRALLLRIEQELVSFAKDCSVMYKFPPMSSYQRMLVHRCAAYFGMDHNVEISGKCVIVTRTKNTRIPDMEFRHHIKEDIVFSEEPPRRSILKRDSNSIEDYSFKSPDRQFSLENRRSKSFEEREEEYEKVRRRIFNREMQDTSESAEEIPWSDMPWSSTESENSSKLRLHPPDHHSRSMGRLLKVHSEEVGEETLRPHVAKSYSFGGYGGVSVLTRGDSCTSTHSAGPRLLTKQDSGASSVSWRLSPSSSGYKTQSQRSESITPSPTSTPYLSGDSIRQDSTNSMGTNVSDIPTSQADEQSEPQLVWAVTDIHSVPKGSIIINPQTLQPVKNQDGSLYHYDPTNPPPRINNTNSAKPPPSPQKVQSPVKSNNQRPLSPKRKSRASPIKKSYMTNSSTSPSLPYTPPLQHTRNFPFSQSADNITNVPMQQQFPMYGTNFGPPPEGSVVYQQPCIVYTAPSYGVPVAYDSRIEPPMGDIPGYYVNVGENTNNPTTQSITYQPSPPVWNQQPIAYYGNASPAGQPQRFAVPIPNQPGPYISASYPPPNFMPHPSQSHPQNTPNSEVVPVYSQQPVQVVYPAPQSQPIYPNQGIIYTQNPLYASPSYPAQNINYPQCTSTASSCASSISNAGFCGGQTQETNMHIGPPSFNQLTQGMGQLNISGPNNQGGNFGQNSKVGFPMVQYDLRGQRSSTPKGNKFNNMKNFGSSQSSTGTNSPATTVIAGFNPNAGLYRTPPETPPTPHMTGGFPPNFMQPMVMRQMSNVHASPPVTNRSSRSPTPASDIIHVDRHRMPLPSAVYQGMPYVLQSEPRIVPGRGQPSAYRQPPIRQQSLNQGSDGNSTKGHKNKKSRGNKASNLPPNGKSV